MPHDASQNKTKVAVMMNNLNQKHHHTTTVTCVCLVFICPQGNHRSLVVTATLRHRVLYINIYIYIYPKYIYISYAQRIFINITNTQRRIQKGNFVNLTRSNLFCAGDVVQAAVTGRLGRQLKFLDVKVGGSAGKRVGDFPASETQKGFFPPSHHT